MRTAMGERTLVIRSGRFRGAVHEAKAVVMEYSVKRDGVTHLLAKANTGPIVERKEAE